MGYLQAQAQAVILAVASGASPRPAQLMIISSRYAFKLSFTGSALWRNLEPAQVSPLHVAFEGL